jgi:outer membrane protein assembly factor BamB
MPVLSSRAGLALVGLACLLPLPAGAADEANWPRFRGPDGLGIAQGKGKLPVHFGPSRNVRWKTAVPAGLSSPCIQGKYLFLTGYDATARKLETLCLDRGRGTILWRKAAPAESIERVNRTSSPAASTPACDGERLFVYFGSYGLICYDLAGKELWKAPLPAGKTREGSGSSPVVADGVVVVKQQGQPSALVAFDAKTGAVRWKKGRLAYDLGYSLPLIRRAGKTREVVVHGERGIKGYDLVDGKERWSAGVLFCEAIPTPVLAGGLAFFVSQFTGGDQDDHLQLPDFGEMLKKYDKNKNGMLDYDEIKDVVFYSRDAGAKEGDLTFGNLFGSFDRNGDGKISRFEWGLARLLVGAFNNSLTAMELEDGKEKVRTKVVWRERNALPEVATPLVYQGRIYLIKHGGILSCLQAKTGKLVYRGRVGATGLYYSSPVAGDGKVYLATTRGVVVVVGAGDKLRVLARNDLGETIGATPALLDGVLYLRAGKHLYAFQE